MNKTILAAAVLVASACGGGESVDVSGLASVDGYGDWAHFDFHGDLAGHGKSYRAVFVNDEGTRFSGVGPYPIGTVIVKEVRELRSVDGAPAPGGLFYVAVMRKVGLPAPEGLPVDGEGWLFTTRAEGGTETRNELCWSSCHRQAPLDGTFFDYGR